MKKRNIFAALFLMICLVTANLYYTPDTVSAKELVKISQAKKLAKKQVKGASVIKAEKDDDDGMIVFEVKLSKGKKLYDLVYRASDSKLLSYDWEIKSRYIKKASGKSISTSKCRNLAKKQVSGASITSIVKKYNDGISTYKVKMKKKNKKYELKFHAITGKLLEYEWELTSQGANSQNGGEYIGEEKASQIALGEAGGGTVVKVKFEVDDGIPTYEIDIINGDLKYEIKIHAKTGKVLETEQEPISGNQLPPQETTSQITLEAAKEIAAADAGVSVSEVTYTKAKLDREDGILVYEIEFCTATHEYEYEINASTGAIYSKKKEVLPGGGSSSGGSGSTEETDIGIEAAKQIALQEAGGGTVVKAKADRDDGILVYEVEIINGNFKYEIKIHAQTGKILEVDKEYKENSQQPSDEESQITLEEAKAAALTDAGVTEDEVTYTKTKLDQEDGILVYEIEFYTATHEYEYEINASTGAVYSKKKEVLPGGGSSSGDSGSTEETDIGIEAAKQIALKAAGGVTIQKAELDQEDGVYVYEIKIRNGEQEYEIKINAQTGEVLEVDVESVHS